MAEAVVVPGAALIRVDTGSASALETVGYTRNGAEVIREGYFLDVPGDQNGGDDGPPIEIQYLGEIARVRLELTKWDSAITAKFEQRLKGSVTVGTPATTGGLMFAGGFTYRLLIQTTLLIRNFTRAFPRAAFEINQGTKWAAFICEFECHKDGSGVLFNTTTS